MQINNRTIFLGASIIALSSFIYHIGQILPIFIWGFFIAYLCLPLCEKLTILLKNRSIAALITTLGIYLLLAFFISIIPIVISQMGGFFNTIPTKLVHLQSKFLPHISGLVDTHQKFLTDHITQISKHLFNILDNIVKSGFNIINVIGMTLILPIVVFFILKDWHLLQKNSLALIPPSYQPASKRLLHDISVNLSSYLRGQFSVCIILSSIYGLGLYAMKLDYGLVIGGLTGLLSFVPYIGSVCGLIIALIVGFMQYNSWQYLVYLSLVFGIIQVIDTYIISAKFIGDKIGIHPIGMMFALLVGGNFFGFSGILLSIPVASMIIIVMRFIIKQYKESKLYV